MKRPRFPRPHAWGAPVATTRAAHAAKRGEIRGLAPPPGRTPRGSQAFWPKTLTESGLAPGANLVLRTRGGGGPGNMPHGPGLAGRLLRTNGPFPRRRNRRFQEQREGKQGRPHVSQNFRVLTTHGNTSTSFRQLNSKRNYERNGKFGHWLAIGCN